MLMAGRVALCTDQRKDICLTGYTLCYIQPKNLGGNMKAEEEAKNNLREAIELILEDRRQDILRGLPKDVIREKIVIG